MNTNYDQIANLESLFVDQFDKQVHEVALAPAAKRSASTYPNTLNEGVRTPSSFPTKPIAWMVSSRATPWNGSMPHRFPRCWTIASGCYGQEVASW